MTTISTKEDWRSVDEFPDYVISNLGRVKSLKFNKEKILSQVLTGPKCCQYLAVPLYNEKCRKLVTVHRLVASTFIPIDETVTNKLVVDHIDGNKLNNKLENLRYVTVRENASNKLGKLTGKYSSKYTGVCYNKSNDNYVAFIMLNSKRTYLGSYKKEEEASKVYQEALKSGVIKCI